MTCTTKFESRTKQYYTYNLNYKKNKFYFEKSKTNVELEGHFVVRGISVGAFFRLQPPEVDVFEEGVVLDVVGATLVSASQPLGGVLVQELRKITR